ncbi:hypothetical protein [Sphingomicrobium nitratireducens]|uniref:hypothetical protein n=1 Tax=Sphingomicrobium nitratireducens TaxID=2964666 RepID=UPI00223EC1C7|nr:hypothetical protein [Sphingomicrobium nitratireducens]
MTIIRFVSIVVAAFIAVPMPAQAADFIFDVPVRIENMTWLNRIRVECYVSSQMTPYGPPYTSLSHLIGRAYVDQPITNGNFEGTLTIKVDNRSDYQNSEAAGYICSMGGEGRAPNGSRIAFNVGGFSESYERVSGAAPIELTNMVYDTLP